MQQIYHRWIDLYVFRDIQKDPKKKEIQKFLLKIDFIYPKFIIKTLNS
jgi:hypothetical protein